jgi:hypothetical protein
LAEKKVPRSQVADISSVRRHSDRIEEYRQTLEHYPSLDLNWLNVASHRQGQRAQNDTSTFYLAGFDATRQVDGNAEETVNKNTA